MLVMLEKLYPLTPGEWDYKLWWVRWLEGQVGKMAGRPPPMSLWSDKHSWASCEGFNISGNFCRNKLKYPAFCKGVSTNPLLHLPTPTLPTKPDTQDCSRCLVEPLPCDKKNWMVVTSVLRGVLLEPVGLSSQGVCHVR